MGDAIETSGLTRSLSRGLSALRRQRGSAGRPERRADLRVAFAIERRLLPALLLVALIAAVSAAALQVTWVWGWLALAATGAAVRFLLGTVYAETRAPIPPEARCARQYLACAVAEVLLWAALLGLVPRPEAFVAGPGGFAAAGIVLLAALSFGTWPRVWTFYIAAWAAIMALVAVRTQGALSGFALGFPVWLLAAWWLGRQQPLARHADARGANALISNPTKFGWQAAIHAMPTPVIVARNGRIIEINRPACEFFGRAERSILGTSLSESLIADPPEALQPEKHKSASSAEVKVRAADRTFEGALWSGRVRYMEPGRPGSIMVLALTRAAQETPAVAGLLDDARRFADWMGPSIGAGGVPWYRDERGLLALPAEFALPPDAVAPTDAQAFPLLHLLDGAERERIAAAWREALRSNAVFDESMSLRDVQGSARERRVVCVARPVPVAAGGVAAVIGTLAEARPAPARVPVQPTADLLMRMPVLVWLVDSAGRVVHAAGNDPRRWGLVLEARTRPGWDSAFAFKPESVATVQAALTGALNGKPTFDVRNARTSRSGGRLNLRSHFVPFEARGLQAALVMDTIASPGELMEIDKLRRSKAQYKALVEASASLIWACDADFTLTFVSRRAARDIYGYEVRELLGKPATMLLPDDAEQPAVRRAFEGLREGRSIRDLEPCTSRRRDAA